MGSHLGPVLANLFIGFYEKEWLKEFVFCKLLLYWRYLDNKICSFNCQVDAIKFFDYLKFIHPNIEFTYEKQNHILISNKNDNFCNSVFHKKTSIGLYSNYTSFAPFLHKIGLIKTLLHCASKICSSWNFYDQKKQTIKSLLMKNLY